tara:strand:- start:2416 stop:3084 length:669 start_codon:yes stop_codon:yes gene_type:complete
MNENDKILINAYFDDDLSSEEIKYVENLINSNPNANDYANKIKKANMEISSYFNTQENRDLNFRIANFVSDLRVDKNNYSIFNFIKRFFTPHAITGYALTAVIGYFILIPINMNDENMMFFDANFSEFSEEIITINLNKYRGEPETDEELNKFFIETIEYMIENKMKNIVMSYGVDSYYLKLQNLDSNSYEEYCFSGYYRIKNENVNFIFCKSADETSFNTN